MLYYIVFFPDIFSLPSGKGLILKNPWAHLYHLYNVKKKQQQINQFATVVNWKSKGMSFFEVNSSHSVIVFVL